MADTTDRNRLPVTTPSSIVPAPQTSTAPAWPVRPSPSALPFVGQGFGARRRARAFARNLDLATTAAEAARRYFAAAEAAEAAHQSAEAQHERRRALPVVAETERAAVLTTFTRAAMELDAARQERQQRAADHQRHQQIVALEWQKAALALHADVSQAAATLDAIRGMSDAERARRARQQEIEKENHRIEMLRRDLVALDLIAEVRSRLDAMRGARNDTPADTTPDAFKRHYAMSEEVRRNRSEADRRIEDIYLRAASERRPLTDEELEHVDALADAAEGAEAEVRRGAASDLK